MLKFFSDAINDGLHTAMNIDPTLLCYGLGATDPKGVFGTTLGLEQRFGSERVFDMPTSENGMTGIGVGAALNGVRSVMVHQRLDFFLLAMDQLVNSAAKWHYMFGSQLCVPITIRLILGRGWGQGPTHSQNLHAWFAHIPGLKVVMPTTPSDAKGLLLSSIFDPNPVVFLEHRWLHGTRGEVLESDVREPLGKAKIIQEGRDITVVSMSYMTVEARHALACLTAQGISCELIDLRTIRPCDFETIENSVKKTGRLMVLDTGATTGSFAGEIITRITTKLFSALKCAPVRLAMPDIPEPTSFALTKGFYIEAKDIAKAVLDMFEKPTDVLAHFFKEVKHHDKPGDWFQGPF